MISVVVPAHDAAATVVDCVEALKVQENISSDYEIILVDDGSTDDTAALARAAGARVIEQDQRRGASAARNVGIQAAQGDIICFTDADCIPFPDWLSRIILPLNNSEIVACKGVYATSQTAIPARFVQQEYEDKYDLLHGQERIDFVDTYSAAFRRSVLIANDGFDERIHFAEDRELAYRLASRGYQMTFQPAAIVSHQHSDSVSAYFRKKFFIGYYVAQTIRRYPAQGFKDSHTPQVMKVQILLMALILISLATALIAPAPMRGWGLLLPAGILLLFLFTTLPFVRKAWRKDRTVAVAAPLLLMVRALALGLGYTWGTLRPLPGISGEKESIGGLAYVGKRAMDIVGGIAGLLALVLLGPMVAAVVRIQSKGPVLVSFERIGQRGRAFTYRRFRSTPRGRGVAAGLARFLGRWRLDRLPEAWNLLTGDISLVGPCAESAEVVARYSDRHRRRLAVKPGITGPVQLHPDRCRLAFEQRFDLELAYIEHHSLRLDAIYLLRSARELVRNKPRRLPDP